MKWLVVIHFHQWPSLTLTIWLYAYTSLSLRPSSARLMPSLKVHYQIFWHSWTKAGSQKLFSNSSIHCDLQKKCRFWEAKHWKGHRSVTCLTYRDSHTHLYHTYGQFKWGGGGWEEAGLLLQFSPTYYKYTDLPITVSELALLFLHLHTHELNCLALG